MRATHTQDIDGYIAAFPAEVQARLDQLRRTIQRAAPAATEAIKYGMPTFVLGENLVHFAGYKHHIGLYPTPSAIQAFAAQLSKWRSSKGAVQFPLDEPLPLGLVGKMVRFRVNEATARARAKKRR